MVELRNIPDTAAGEADASFLISQTSPTSCGFFFLSVMNHVALLKRGKLQPETGGRAKLYIENHHRETESNHLWY